MSKRVLFVDDEPSILGIYEMLEPFFGEDFSVATAAEGEQALRLMDEQPADVLVSDLTMPNMSGIELLTETSNRFPATARIVVSGFADEVTTAKCLMIAHRYVSKPFNPTGLTELIKGLCDAQTSAVNEKIRECVGKIHALPTVSRTYMELSRALRSNAMPVRDVSAIIERDLALTAKVLQMVNSVRFARSSRVSNVFDAVQLIGFDVVRALVMSIQIFEFCQGVAKSPLFQNVWDHSLGTAFCARRLAQMEGLATEACEEAFLLGLLHDIGKVILAASSTEYHFLWEENSADSAALLASETERFGANHAQVGAYLLRLWGLSDTLAEGVHYHHQLPEQLTEFNPLIALHVAQELSQSRATPRLDEDLVARLGMQNQIPSWTAAIAKEEAKANGSAR